MLVEMWTPPVREMPINRGERVRTDLLGCRPGRDNEILAGDPPPPRHRLMTYTSV